jgi:hypothetical protein
MSVAPLRDSKVVEAVIRKAAERTGVDFGFLLKTARRESSLNPKAKAQTSSAAGLFQFVEQTWLGQLKRHGAKHGYASIAQMIERGKDGRLRVPDQEARRAVMDLRFDPSCSALMAGELASDHAAYLKGRIGRDASGGELYAAHFLGPNGAARLIEACERNPQRSAASLFPQAAASNKSIFYRQGRPASVAEVYANLTKSGAAERSGQAPGATPDKAAPGAAHAAFSLNERLERMRQEQSLVDVVLKGSGAGRRSPYLDSETLSLLAAARDDE